MTTFRCQLKNMWEDASFLRSWNEPWAKTLKLLCHCSPCPSGRATSWSPCHMPSSRCGSEKVLGNCGTVWAGTGLRLLRPNPQALRQGCVTTGLLAGLPDDHEEGRGQAPPGQSRTCQSEPRLLCQLGSCCEPGLPPEGAPLSRFSACPRLRKVALSKSQEGGAPPDPASLCIRGPAAQWL